MADEQIAVIAHLGQEERDPPESIKLWIHLHTSMHKILQDSCH